jgi:hypothetical protein
VSQVCEERDEALAEVDRLKEIHGIAPFDGKGKIRPHTIPGQWQVWTGSLCFMLLSTEDVAPIVAGWRKP